MNRIVIARDLGLLDIPGALVRSAKPAKERKAIKRSQKPIARSPVSKKPKNPLKKLYAKIDDLIQYAVRIRDTEEDGGTRYGACVSCQRVYPFAKLQGGHFIPRTNFATRWDWNNLNAQCVKCNSKSGPPVYGLSGNPVGYRKELVRRHGEAFVLRMEASKGKGKRPSEVEAGVIYEEMKKLVKAKGWNRP